MPPIKPFIYFISIVFNLVLGVLVFLKDRKKKTNQSFFVAIIFAIGWLISLFLFYTVESPDWVLWLGRINFAVVLPMLYFLLKFAAIFPQELIFVSRKTRLGLASWIFFFTVLTLFTPLIDKEEIITGPGQRETVYGPLYFLYILHYIVAALVITGLLFYKLKKIKDETEKNQTRYLLIGLSLALVFGFITQILLPLFRLFEASHYGPLATVVFSAFVTAAIFKHYLFNIKVIGVELFTGLLLFFLLLNVFIPPTQRVLNVIVFLGALVFGILSVRSVIQETKARERIEKMSKRLQKAYEELKKVDEAKSEFIAMASHQLRTPLSAIKGYASMLLEGIYGKMPQKAKKPLENISISNQRLVGIVESLLNVSRIEMGKMETKKEKTSIEKIIDEVYEEMKIRAKEKNLEFIWEKPKTALPQLLIDRLKIRQVVLNLLDNALRYTQKGEIEVKTKKTDSQIQISVRDTGEGLTKDEKEKIFEAFSRGGAGTTYWIQGAGLGLYLAKKYVELHQGKIWAESKGKGKGSTFYVQLPIK